MKKVYRRKDTPVTKQGTGPTNLVMPAIEGIGENEELEEEEAEEDELEEEQEEEEEATITECDAKHDSFIPVGAPPDSLQPSSSFQDEIHGVVSASSFRDVKDDKIVTRAANEINRNADCAAMDETVRAQSDDEERGNGMLRGSTRGSGQSCTATGDGKVEEAGGGEEGGGGEGGGGVGGSGSGLVKRFSSSGSVSAQHSRLSDDNKMAVELQKIFANQEKLDGVEPLETIRSDLHQPSLNGDREKHADNKQTMARKEIAGLMNIDGQASPVIQNQEADEISSSTGSQNALTDPAEGRGERYVCSDVVEEHNSGENKPRHVPLSTSDVSQLISQSSSGCYNTANCQPLDKVPRPSEESCGDQPDQPSRPGPSDGTKDSQIKASSSSDRGHYGGVRPKTAKVLHRKNTPALLPKVEKLYATRTKLPSDGILSEEKDEDDE